MTKLRKDRKKARCHVCDRDFSILVLSTTTVHGTLTTNYFCKTCNYEWEERENIGGEYEN